MLVVLRVSAAMASFLTVPLLYVSHQHLIRESPYIIACTDCSYVVHFTPLGVETDASEPLSLTPVEKHPLAEDATPVGVGI